MPIGVMILKLFATAGLSVEFLTLAFDKTIDEHKAGSFAALTICIMGVFAIWAK